MVPGVINYMDQVKLTAWTVEPILSASFNNPCQFIHSRIRNDPMHMRMRYDKPKLSVQPPDTQDL
jgi:hypothetical protein